MSSSDTKDTKPPTIDHPANTNPPVNKSKAEKIATAQANLPLPDDPPVASDWNSADARTVNIGAEKGDGGGPPTERDTAGEATKSSR